jgi:hypothetical protein
MRQWNSAVRLDPLVDSLRGLFREAVALAVIVEPNSCRRTVELVDGKYGVDEGPTLLPIVSVATQQQK